MPYFGEISELKKLYKIYVKMSTEKMDLDYTEVIPFYAQTTDMDKLKREAFQVTPMV